MDSTSTGKCSLSRTCLCKVIKTMVDIGWITIRGMQSLLDRGRLSHGGAIYCSGRVDLRLRNSQFVDNTATVYFFLSSTNLHEK